MIGPMPYCRAVRHLFRGVDRLSCRFFAAFVQFPAAWHHRLQCRRPSARTSAAKPEQWPRPANRARPAHRLRPASDDEVRARTPPGPFNRVNGILLSNSTALAPCALLSSMLRSLSALVTRCRGSGPDRTVRRHVCSIPRSCTIRQDGPTGAYAYSDRALAL